MPEKTPERKQAELAWFLAIEAQHGMPSLIKAIRAHRRGVAERNERERRLNQEKGNRNDG